MPHAEKPPTKDAARSGAALLGRGVLVLLAGLYLSVFGVAGWIGIGFLRHHPFILDGPIQYYYALDGYLQPAILHGEHVLVWPNYYEERLPQYGDIAVFSLEDDPEGIYMMRIVGLPDDLMQTVQGVLLVNGTALEREKIGVRSVMDPEDPERSVRVTEYLEHLPNGRTHLIWEENADGLFDKPSLSLVPKDQVLGLDDYRNNWLGNESAEVGVLVPIERLRHRAEVIIWSDDWSRIGLRLYDEE